MIDVDSLKLSGPMRKALRRLAGESIPGEGGVHPYTWDALRIRGLAKLDTIPSREGRWWQLTDEGREVGRELTKRASGSAPTPPEATR